MPHKGALSDQPNNLVIALDEIALAKSVLDAEDMKAGKSSSGNDEGKWKPVR